ncbi:MAG: DMT family transporter [Armatimonadota bacterium]|nr:DMT family transporter [Armatimonadota bacterium]MDR7518270.1 DMT family transporter [Armatimonadota bacterium]
MGSIMSAAPLRPGGSARLRLAADLSLLAVAAVWGLTFSLGKMVLAALPPFTYLAARFTIGAVLLVAVAPARRAALPARSWMQAAAVGVVFFLGYGLQTVGLRLTTASKAAFITGLSVVLVPVIASVWLRRRPRGWVWAGIASATAGLALLTLDDPMGATLGDLLVLGCAVCFALHIVLVGRLAPALDPLAFAAAQVVSVAALSTLAASVERPLRALVAAPPGIWGILLFMAVAATVGALVIQNWAQRFTSPSHTGLMFTFEPVAAAVAAHLLLGEVLRGRQALGALLILIGIVVAEVGPEA